jgi:hypothetical protein
MPHRRTHALAFAFAAVLAALSFLAPAHAQRVDAASCNGASHPAPTLSSGRASPGSGSPKTSITFSVRYVDAVGCAPSSVEVIIAGVGRYRMRGSGTAYASGVTFRFTRRLPAGRWSYRFSASSGSGAGQRSVTLTGVSPSRVVIKRPTSTAPKPTPRPTAAPRSGTKPKPPKATPRPATAPSATGSPSAQPGDQAPAPSTPASSNPAQVGSGYPGGGPDERGESTRGGGFRGLAGISGPGGLGLGLDPAVLVPVATWSLTTAFGVLVFGLGLLPVRRRRDPARARRSWIGRAALAPAANEPGQMSPPVPSRSTGSSGGPAPRSWGAVGSVDEAAAAGLTSTVREPLRFQAPPRPGVERRTIAYRFIRVADQPDSTGSSEICRLDRGDEIEIIGEHEGYLRIRTPTGIEGWVQRMVIVG